ncbi:MAG TPA: hypothetical protein VMN57_15000, partial [Anaerolineales bacterium]|nr:hypothetical protein [Anaerolineales bacterium]
LDRTYRNKMRCWDTAWAWSREHLEPEKEQVVLEFLLRQVVDLPRFNRELPRWAQKRLQLVLRLFENPALARERLFWVTLLPTGLRKA